MQSRDAFFRITTWLSLAGYLLVASGLPLPIGRMPTAASAGAKRLAGKDRTQPFLCMDKPCGCATAEQCFTSCCCTTPAERLAWAKAHRVEAAILAALERRVAAQAAASRPPAKASCCSFAAPQTTLKARATTCCESQAEPPCCASGPGCATEPAAVAAESTSSDEPEPPATPEPPRSRTVVLRAMLACGGIVSQWCAAGASLPPPRVEAAIGFDPVVRIAVVDEALEGPHAVPAAPPPRTA